jgi:hypothetical protein
MGEKGMNPASFLALFDGVSLWRLSAFAAAGGIGGALYFLAVWRSTKALAGGARLSKALVPMLARFLLMGLLLGLAARQGAAPLLATAAGVLLGRALVLRRAKAWGTEAAP